MDTNKDEDVTGTTKVVVVVKPPPKGTMGPCDVGQGQGAAVEIELETRDALCACPRFHCLLDSRNRIVTSFRQGDMASPFAIYASKKDGIITPKDLTNASVAD